MLLVFYIFPSSCTANKSAIGLSPSPATLRNIPTVCTISQNRSENNLYPQNPKHSYVLHIGPLGKKENLFPCGVLLPDFSHLFVCKQSTSQQPNLNTTIISKFSFTVSFITPVKSKWVHFMNTAMHTKKDF